MKKESKINLLTFIYSYLYSDYLKAKRRRKKDAIYEFEIETLKTKLILL